MINREFKSVAPVSLQFWILSPMTIFTAVITHISSQLNRIPHLLFIDINVALGRSD